MSRKRVPTAEMTLGPFFPREFAQGANDLTRLDGRPVEGEPIEITGRVTQLDGKPLDNLAGGHRRSAYCCCIPD